MKRQQSGEEMIGEKLNEIVAPSTAGLWQQMKNLLNKQMPLQKGRVALQECFCNDQDNEIKIDPEQDSGGSAENDPAVKNGSLHFFN